MLESICSAVMEGNGRARGQRARRSPAWLTDRGRPEFPLGTPGAAQRPPRPPRARSSRLLISAAISYLLNTEKAFISMAPGERCFANLTSCEQRHLQLHMISSCKPHRLHLRDSLTSVSAYTRTSAIVLQT